MSLQRQTPAWVVQTVSQGRAFMATIPCLIEGLQQEMSKIQIDVSGRIAARLWINQFEFIS